MLAWMSTEPSTPRLTPLAGRTLRSLARARCTSRAVRLHLRGEPPAGSRLTATVLALAHDAPRWLAATLVHEQGALRVLDLDQIRDATPSRARARPAPAAFDALAFAAGNYLGWGAAPERRFSLRPVRGWGGLVGALLPTAAKVRCPGQPPTWQLRGAGERVLLSLAGSLGLPAAIESAPPLPRSRTVPTVDTAAVRCLRLASWLLSQSEPVSRERIYAAFPEEYAGQASAKEKKFGRDKNALKDLGFAIETVELGTKDEAQGYLVDAHACALPAIEFTADEAALLWAAGAGALRLSDHPLRAELENALRKLIIGGKGLPPRALGAEDGVAAEGEPEAGTREQRQRRAQQGKWLAKLDEARQLRKRLTIDYWRAGSGEVVTRQVDVYGWASRRGEWIFVGHCHLRGGVRIFYLSRCRALKMNGVRAQDPDYQIPDDFDVRRWSRQQLWDYQVHPPLEAALRLRGSLARIARVLLPEARITSEADGSRTARLQVRNLRGLVRQALAWGPEAELTAPPEGRAMAREILAPLAAARPGVAP